MAPQLFFIFFYLLFSTKGRLNKPLYNKAKGDAGDTSLQGGVQNKTKKKNYRMKTESI
jgi:hypothetical protein